MSSLHSTARRPPIAARLPAMCRPAHLLVLACCVLGCPADPAPAPPRTMPASPASAAPQPTTIAPAKAADTTPAPPAPQTFDDALASIDTQLSGRRQLATDNGRSWLAYGNVASLYLARARLTGQYDDYAAAEQALATAFSLTSTEAAGPFLIRARMNFSLHRFDRVGPDLERVAARVALGRADDDKGALLRANLAFERGDYQAAKTQLHAVAERRPTLASLSSLAQYYWKTADFERADELYARGLAGYHGPAHEPIAWVHLQRGLMDLDRGRLDDALAHYRRAEAALSGYWLIDEHIAEILTVQGQTEQARAMYLDIVERTDNPEFMDALAELEAEAGNDERAAAWVARARARYDRQLARYPEAAYGHALGHWLSYEPDDAAVVELARRNHALRPNADATRLLAEAYLRANRVADAVSSVEALLATPVRSADVHETAAAVLSAANRPDDAAEQLRAALALDPTRGGGDALEHRAAEGHRVDPDPLPRR